jgi:hypothetical protein
MHPSQSDVDAGSFPSPAPHKTNNAAAEKHGHSGLRHRSAPAHVLLPPSNGKEQGSPAPAYASRQPQQYHSPSYSPG